MRHVYAGAQLASLFLIRAGVIGVVLAPVAAAIGGLTAMIAECIIEVEKVVPDVPEK